MKEFFSGVYRIAAQIPAGYVATYGQIAAILGNPMAARAVGDAMRRVPGYIDIPCHRVVNKSGAMSPAQVFGGNGRQREMLENEGVIFNVNGCVDMGKCLWKPNAPVIMKNLQNNIDSI